MRYEINGNEIRSENAAKPSSQKSSAVDEYLGSLRDGSSVLDFGCGKLRYSDTLVNVASTVTFVDSAVQLSRTQVIRGDRTSVRAYVENHYPNCRTVAYEEMGDHDSKYDIVTCTNVLSAIPCRDTLSNVLYEIRRALKPSGYAVFVNQHRSSYFKKYEDGQEHLFGYLYRGTRGSSYYGIIGKSSIEKLLREHEFANLTSWCVGESTFSEARLS